jgi:chemotaxis protein methyltransferase CheR
LSAAIKITANEQNAFNKYLHEVSGISLGKNKAYLLEGRLADLLTEYQCSSFTDLLYIVTHGNDPSLGKKIIDRMTTHETYFFRDGTPFQLLQHKILPDLIDKRTATNKSSPIPIRIWSAACSTGQEIYSIAIVLRELLTDIDGYQIKLLGTDISDAAIAKASYGKFNRFEIERGLSRQILDKYFVCENDQWKIRDDVRAMVQFAKRNLMQSLDGMGLFDIIFCRNVAVYFSKEDRRNFFNRIARVLSPDGYLIIGSSESLIDIESRFESQEHLKTIFYQIKK